MLTLLSPLVMPETVSFMSDVPAFFFFALSLYGAIRAWKANNAKTCLAWAGLIVVAGVLSALDRQIYWLAPLLFLPLVAWIQRRRKGTLTGLGVAWLLTALAVPCFAAWFQAQPYTIAQHPFLHWKQDGLRYLATRTYHAIADLGMTLGLILLPMLVGYVTPGFRGASRKLAVVVLAIVMVGEYIVAISLHHKMPGIGNIVSPYGILPPGIVAIGPRPVILGPVLRDLLSLLVFLSCAGCGLAIWKGGGFAGARPWKDPATPALVLAAVFGAAYVSAVLFHSAAETAYDRYLIPLLRWPRFPCSVITRSASARASAPGVGPC